MIQIVPAAQAPAVMAAMRERSASKNEAIQAAAAAIMDDVKKRGWAAVEEYSVKFDGKPPARSRGRSWRRPIGPAPPPW